MRGLRCLASVATVCVRSGADLLHLAIVGGVNYTLGFGLKSVDIF